MLSDRYYKQMFHIIRRVLKCVQPPDDVLLLGGWDDLVVFALSYYVFLMHYFRALAGKE
jgi:hypothetical protein